MSHWRDHAPEKHGLHLYRRFSNGLIPMNQSNKQTVHISFKFYFAIVHKYRQEHLLEKKDLVSFFSFDPFTDSLCMRRLKLSPIRR